MTIDLTAFNFGINDSRWTQITNQDVVDKLSKDYDINKIGFIKIKVNNTTYLTNMFNTYNGLSRLQGCIIMSVGSAVLCRIVFDGNRYSSRSY